jgi:hypothetical protein
MKRYKALALQTECFAINKYAERKTAYAKMEQSLQKVLAETKGSKAFIGPDLKLVVYQ